MASGKTLELREFKHERVPFGLKGYGHVLVTFDKGKVYLVTNYQMFLWQRAADVQLFKLGGQWVLTQRSTVNESELEVNQENTPAG